MNSVVAVSNDIEPTKIPIGRRSKRPDQSTEDGPIDYAFRDPLPLERHDQLTRKGEAKAGLTDPRLARLQWFILRTAPREEMRATLLLERKGHAVLNPRECVFRRKNRYYKPKVHVLRPLANGYLFGGFMVQPNWFDVLAIASLIGVVGLDGRPRQVSFTTLVSFMKNHAARVEPDLHRYMVSNKEFAEGDIVEVLAGPLGGEHVKVQEIRGRYARTINALTGGPQQPFDIPLDNLAALT